MQTDRAVGADVMPALPVHALSPVHSTTPLPAQNNDLSEDAAQLSRSASYTYLSGQTKTNSQPIKRTFSENVLSMHTPGGNRVSDNMQSANKELFRRASRKARRRLSGARFSLSAEDDEIEKEASAHNIEDVHKSGLSRSVTGTIRSFARKSWMPGSRPTSPVRKEEPAVVRKRSWSPSRKAAVRAVEAIALPEPVASRPASRSSHRGDDDDDHSKESAVLLRQDKALQKPLSALPIRNRSESSLKRLSTKSSLSSLRSHSARGSQLSLATMKIPPLPSSISTDRLVPSGDYRRKDPLWNVFRTIEGEFNGFQSKTGLQKAKVLRATFLPFLSKYATHSSTKSLRAEDLDRRVVILNKWWTGILEMLNGRNNQSISGTDRPVFLEAATGLMMRPEWRIPKFTSTPSDTLKPPSVTRSKSTNSLQSDDSDFLTDTIHQNVRNIFVQNLLSQISFVVEKLSMRSAPASLVNFGGKVCAYAFFFCPGVADILTRLWRLSANSLRRMLGEVGVDHTDKLDLISKGLLSSFPSPVRSLQVLKQGALLRHLQRRGSLPPGAENLPWYGPWTGRWSGRDSDLIFVFTKYYHILVSEFLTEGVTRKERACIPGYIPLHAQLLTVLETTLYRQAGQHTGENYASGLGGDMDPDASAPIPMTITNASRSIGENRLIMLLRDILADPNPDHSNLQAFFASSFDDIIKAATRRISLYNNDACFVLCDFMEEVLPIVSRYHQHHDAQDLDWAFWLQVCRQMMQSQTTLTQVRLIAFVYTTWSIFVSDEQRKREIILGWLLDREFFYQHFCHWSPMVRHYYYRLLCWRVARCDGAPSDLDLEILETLSARLRRCWAHYQYLSAEADMRQLYPPSSAPCSPAPSRQLIIMRTDSQPVPSTLSTFDRFLPHGLISQNTPYQSHSSPLNAMPPADTATTQHTKKRWSLFGRMMPFSTLPGNNRPGEVTPPGTPAEGVLADSTNASKQQALSRPTTPPHQALSFRFSLEFVESRPNITNKNKKITIPLLPHNAQRVLEERRQSQESSNNSTNSDAASSTTSHSSHSSPYRSGTRNHEVKPVKPRGNEIALARYTGRALAEWSQVLVECKNFYARRKAEGVPKDSLVECVSLGVETFRMF